MENLLCIHHEDRVHFPDWLHNLSHESKFHPTQFKKPYCLSLDRESDALPHYYLYGGALLAAIIIHKSLNPMDFLWSFSIWLEALAILPQLYMINKLRDIENITAHYVLFLGLYRGFYIFHWYQKQ